MKSLRLQYLPNLKQLLAEIFFPPSCAVLFSVSRPVLFLPPYTGIFPEHLFVRNNSVHRREFFISVRLGKCTGFFIM